ncbi:MAG: type ISP restriction/modification enzyme [Pseudomonadota bacterium]
MSRILINAYLAEIDRLKKFAGTATEEVIRDAFRDLLRGWAKQAGLVFASELAYDTALKTTVKPDGTVLHDIRVPLGYWEAKDEDDDLDAEIEKKFRKGYPQDNVLFEDSKTAILWQNRSEVMRCDMLDTEALEKLVALFFAYERPEIANFRKAVEQFKTDIPAVLEALREQIDAAYDGNPDFAKQARAFLKHAKQTINPTLAEADVREMLIQHILTEEIFNKVFDEGDFHRENNIAKELYALERLFFRGAVKKDTLKALQPYYTAINANAELITNHTEKQTFLKVIYENFYKVYNPDAADRLGVVYTPSEIVRFMIEGTDWLCHQHFGKTLIDRDVQILDPATGTGTFICELIEHFRGQPEKLAYKFKEELHANEVAILPYYVANLNIEATYAAVSGQYAEYPNLCFVDTLDNIAGLGIKSGETQDLFASFSEENVERVNRQNRRKISVVIGNPPYNANQQNENDNNKNRAYPHIDGLIKRSFVRLSTAQKTKVYDMYSRFYRWAADRLHDEGIIAFITNRSFIDSRTFDGFRKYVAEEFNDVYLVDLGGDVRANPKLSGTKHNVFGIQTGVAIAFLVKNPARKGCRIHYVRRPEDETAEDKLAWLGSEAASGLRFEQVEPDDKANWINQAENDWDDLIPVADKKTKAAKRLNADRAIFRLFSLGLGTNRDEWVYDFSRETLDRKAAFFKEVYSDHLGFGPEIKFEDFDKSIKWNSELEKLARSGKTLELSESSIGTSGYRAFCNRIIQYSRDYIHRFYAQDAIFPCINSTNKCINVYSISSSHLLSCLSSDLVVDLGFIKQGNGGTFSLPLSRYTPEGERIDNITDWALNKFNKRYKTKKVTKDDIFHYVYGVLHDPIYRETYAINLKREFPRIPFYPDFAQWAAWGERLMDLHINYETVDPYPLLRRDVPDEKSRAAGLSPKVILKGDRAAGTFTLDSETVLEGAPEAAWDYRLGNRSGVEWVLDQHKEKTPRDPTIREKFNTYRFADYKEKVVDLLMRVTTVSVETMSIVQEMRVAKRDDP